VKPQTDQRQIRMPTVDDRIHELVAPPIEVPRRERTAQPVPVLWARHPQPPLPRPDRALPGAPSAYGKRTTGGETRRTCARCDTTGRAGRHARIGKSSRHAASPDGFDYQADATVEAQAILRCCVPCVRRADLLCGLAALIVEGLDRS
jgi:hypothetical protein